MPSRRHQIGDLGPRRVRRAPRAGADRSGEHQRDVVRLHHLRERLEQHGVILVRVGRCGIQDVGPAHPEFAQQLRTSFVGHRRHRSHDRRHDDDLGGVEVERVDRLRSGELAHRRHDLGPLQRAALCQAEIAALRSAEVRRVRQVLQIVQRDHRRHPATGRHDPAEVVHQVDLLSPQMSWQPGVFDDHAPHHMAAFRHRRDDGVCRRGQLRVFLHEPWQPERDHVDVVALDQRREQAGRVALAAADDSRHQPQQIEADGQCHDTAARYASTVSAAASSHEYCVDCFTAAVANSSCREPSTVSSAAAIALASSGSTSSPPSPTNSAIAVPVT